MKTYAEIIDAMEYNQLRFERLCKLVPKHLQDKDYAFSDLRPLIIPPGDIILYPSSSDVLQIIETANEHLVIIEFMEAIAQFGLEAEFVDTTTECPLYKILINGVDTHVEIGLPIGLDPNYEFGRYTMFDTDSHYFSRGGLFFLLAYVFAKELDGEKADAQDITDGNCVAPILFVELNQDRQYPHQPSENEYTILLPNSINDNVDNEEFNNFLVATRAKGDVNNPTNNEVIKEATFKTIQEVKEYIFCEK